MFTAAQITVWIKRKCFMQVHGHEFNLDYFMEVLVQY